MKHVTGGVVDVEDGEGPCLLAYRAQEDNSWLGWSVNTFSVSQAQSDYQNGATLMINGVRAYVSGYCCASC